MGKRKLVFMAVCAALFVEQAGAAEPRIEPAGLESYFDDLFAGGGKYRYDGAVVAVVHDGETVFVKGYGSADAGGTVAVDPEETRFRISSISKMFAGTAIGQLIDQGLIQSVDDPVNTYLTRYQLPKHHGQEITLRQLLTHRAGYEDRALSLYTRPNGFPELTAKYLKSIQPKGVRIPGYTSIYSNFGAGLVGVIAEDITGQSFADYLQRNIFDPLAMTHAQVIDAPQLLQNVASGKAFYPNGETNLIPNNWSFTPIVVRSGGVVASGHDMARYMIGLLGGSTKQGLPSLLGTKGRNAVFSRLGGNHSAVDGFGALFFVGEWNGVTHAGHTGYMPGFRSSLLLIPQYRIGVYTAVTGEPGRPGPSDMLAAAMGKGRMIASQAGDRRGVPVLSALRSTAMEPLFGPYRYPKASDMTEVNLSEYAGRYFDMRRAYSTITMAVETLYLPGRLMVVEEDGTGGLTFNGREGFMPVDKDVFWRDAAVHGEPSGFHDVYAFRRDAEGAIDFVAYQYGNSGYEPVSGLSDPAAWKTITVIFILLLMSGFFALFWPRRTKLAGYTKAVAMALAILTPLLPILYFSSFADVDGVAYRYLFTPPSGFLPFVVAANICALLAISLIGLSPLALRSAGGNSIGSYVHRAHLGVVVIGALLLVITFFRLNLIGVNLP